MINITFSLIIEGYLLSVRAGYFSSQTIKDCLTTWRSVKPADDARACDLSDGEELPNAGQGGP